LRDEPGNVDRVIARIRMHGSFTVAIEEVRTGNLVGRYIEGRDYYVSGPRKGELCPAKPKTAQQLKS